MTKLRVTLWIVFVVLLAGAPSPVRAAGGGGGDDSAARKPVDPDYTAAVKAIKAGQYPAAIRLLEGVTTRDAKNADAFNWLAYATRKNGDPAAAIPIYEKALALDPGHRGAHEYIGEAYLQLDNLAKAKDHLARLDKLCLLPCSEYSDLKKAVNTYEKSKGAAKPTAAK
ncbi:MAG TPA: tetratricopeptide repeat protein [Candidatus Binatia bacterium]|nr:tetratricopeptide repeat protein [Candidatus Binatia bacterium]